MDAAHWNGVWQGRDPESVTWFQSKPARSMRLIESVSDPTAGVIDVGGGASRLVDHLLAAGYGDITVLDIAAASLTAAQERLGPAANRVQWIVDDVTRADLGRSFDVWHDRAVFHFLVDEPARVRYLGQLNRALGQGGHLVVATFGPEGPEKCSGLPVRRYDADLLQATFGDGFELIAEEIEEHVSPAGVTQQFFYAVFRRLG
jgi:SAM-dependent methyltransferase